jgi:cold shock CspA family protein
MVITMQKGVVKKVDKLQPFGWISPFVGRARGGGAELFFHQNTLAPGETFPAAGDLVTYEIGTDSRGRPCAVGVKKDTVAIAEKLFRHANATGEAVRYGDPLATG